MDKDIKLSFSPKLGCWTVRSARCGKVMGHHHWAPDGWHDHETGTAYVSQQAAAEAALARHYGAALERTRECERLRQQRYRDNARANRPEDEARRERVERAGRKLAAFKLVNVGVYAVRQEA